MAGITGAVLSEAMLNIVSISRYNDLAPSINQAMLQANCETQNRAAMFLAQIGHESMGLRYMEEIASGSAYEGRTDLGNIRKGDGKRFKGRGPIQITGRHNYTQVSLWAYNKGYVPSKTYFVDQPEQMASIKYGFIGAVWYWVVARPGINAMADKGDVTGVTRAINGGLNGLADRQNRYKVCKGLGKSILPGGSGNASHAQGASPTMTTAAPTAGKIHTPFGVPGNWAAKYHPGDDWHNGPKSAGNPVIVTKSGKVVWVGEGNNKPGWGTAFGVHVVIDSGERRTAYCHMIKGSPTVKVGQQVKQGDVIGKLGSTGNVTGPHVHLEERVSPYGYWNHKKPTYPTIVAPPQAAITPPPITEGILGMSTHFYHRRAKDFTHKKGGWRQVALNDAGKAWTVAQENDLVAATATLQLTGLPAGKEAQIRFIEIDYKNGKTNIIAHRHPWVEVIGTAGTTAGQVTWIGKVGKSKRKGYQRRLRLQMNTFDDVKVIDLRVQGFKG